MKQPNKEKSQRQGDTNRQCFILGGTHAKSFGNHCLFSDEWLWMFAHRTHITTVTQFYNVLFLNATHDVMKVVTHNKVCQYNKIMEEVEAKTTSISSTKYIIFYIRTLQSVL